MFLLYLQSGENLYFNCSNITNCKYLGIFSTSVYFQGLKKIIYTILYRDFSFLIMSCAVFISFYFHYDFHKHNLIAALTPLGYPIGYRCHFLIKGLIIIFHYYK